MGRLKTLPSRLGSAVPKLQAAPKQALGFYHSSEWRDLIRDLKRIRGPFCQRCGSRHRVAGDHIVELKDNGAALDASNVELLCASCHNRKTAKAKAARAAGDVA